jgi:hypothetical protein
MDGYTKYKTMLGTTEYDTENWRAVIALPSRADTLEHQSTNAKTFDLAIEAQYKGKNPTEQQTPKQ